MTIKPDHDAIVRIPSQRQVRPAAFVFATDDGFAWVEPSYHDPVANTAPAFHRLQGTIEQDGDSFALVGADGRKLATVRPMYAPGADDPEGSCTAALLAFSDELVAAGVSQAEERLRVERDFAEDLA